MAHNGEGGFPHLAFEHLRLMAGFTYNGIPYKGSAQICTDVIGGQVQVGSWAPGADPPHQGGPAHPAGPHRQGAGGLSPDKPTAGEAVPGYCLGRLVRVRRPGRHAAAIITRLNEEINRAMKSPDVVEKIKATGQIVVAEPVKHAEESSGAITKNTGSWSGTSLQAAIAG